MATTRLTPNNIETHPISSETLRSVFETAVCQIQAQDSADRKLSYRAPIVPRAKILGISKADAEKRALSDAARALAQLWKV